MIIELNTRNLYSVETYFCRTDAFKYSFFPYSISEWNKLGPDLRYAKSYSTFRKLLLRIGRLSPNHIYKIHDPLGLKLLIRLRLGLHHLNEHRFNHYFDSCILYVLAALKWNQQNIFSCTAITTLTFVKLS